METNPTTTLIRYGEAARLAGVSKQLITQMCKSGLLTIAPQGGVYWIVADDLWTTYLQKRRDAIAAKHSAEMSK